MSSLHAFVWCDGTVQPVEAVGISPLDRSLLWGLGAFETLRLHGGRPFLAERHVQRLGRSLAALGLPAPACVAALPEGLVELARRAGVASALCRITVTGGAGKEHADVPRAGMRVVAHLRPAPRPEPRPARVGIAHGLHDARSPLAGVKSTSYVDHYLQREAAERAGRVDDLVVDAEGRIAEGTVSSVFGVRGGALVTPALRAGILAGVTRETVLELARGLGLRVEERDLPRGELALLDEAFLTGAGKVLVGIDELDGRPMPEARPVTDVMRAAMTRRIAEACGVPAADVRF